MPLQNSGSQKMQKKIVIKDFNKKITKILRSWGQTKSVLRR